MLGGHINKDKTTRSMKAEQEKTFDGDDFEHGARRRHDLRESKDNLFSIFHRIGSK